MHRITGWLLALIVVNGAMGCSALSYYAQLAEGHFDLMAAREPIDELLVDPATPDELRRQLSVAQSIRDYASEVLLLPDNDSYRSYADLGRDTVTWNVVATPEFSLEPTTWCFWVAGCIAYRGYYREESAEIFAGSLDQQSMDVDIFGSAAYSTLGWFDDPLLNTMLGDEDFAIAALLFHELAHQKIYVEDDSAFNEAFATFVEQQGVREWLSLHGDRSSLQEYTLRHSRQRDFLQLLTIARGELTALYAEKGSVDDNAADADADEMRQKKRAVFVRLQQNYAELKLRWGGYAGYDRWFSQPLNNAHLVSIATYFEWVPAFAQIYAQQSGWAEFYRVVESFAELPNESRQERLAQYLPDPQSN